MEMFTPFPAIDRKGKAVAFADELTTPSPSNCINNGRFRDTLGHAVDDWHKFKEVGLLNEASLDKKDRDALLETILKLEQELFDYQHNMGLLLIEKKKWTLTNEQLQQAFDEASEILKRERFSNLIALNESEKREENLRKALISEKQFVAELERDLKFLQQQLSEAKSTSEAKLAEANALLIATKETALEVEKKRIITEENLSVINRKSSELERKLKEVETREKVLQREHLSLVTEREAHEAVFYKQREDLQEWEKKLTLKEDNLSEAKRRINHIEEKAIESETSTKKKEKLLEEMQQKIDIAKTDLKAKEEALNDVSLKEKEKELHELEEKLLDDQNAVLYSTRLEFEKELEHMRIPLDEKKKGEIGHKGEQLRKREASLQIMEERFKEKEKDLEARLKAVEEKEYALKDEEKKLHMVNQRLLEDKESLRKLKDEIEEIGAETTEQESRIREEHESLRITREERLEFLRLQSELKQQIDRVKLPEPSQLEDRLDTVAGETSATSLSFADSRIQGPEVSLQSEIKNDKPRRGGRSRSNSVRGRPQSTKPSDGEIPRKRQREHASRITESEHTAGDSDEGVDSITSGGLRKKRQTAIPVSQTSGQSRYYLRRHRNVGTEEDKAVASTSVVEKEENDNLAPLQGEDREIERAENADIITVEAVEDPLLEVGGGSCERKEHRADGDGNLSQIEEENEEEEEETERPGDASIGKKIWVLFTT